MEKDGRKKPLTLPKVGLHPATCTALLITDETPKKITAHGFLGGACDVEGQL